MAALGKSRPRTRSISARASSPNSATRHSSSSELAMPSAWARAASSPGTSISSRAGSWARAAATASSEMVPGVWPHSPSTSWRISSVIDVQRWPDSTWSTACRTISVPTGERGRREADLGPDDVELLQHLVQPVGRVEVRQPALEVGDQARVDAVQRRQQRHVRRHARHGRAGAEQLVDRASRSPTPGRGRGRDRRRRRRAPARTARRWRGRRRSPPGRRPSRPGRRPRGRPPARRRARCRRAPGSRGRRARRRPRAGASRGVDAAAGSSRPAGSWSMIRSAPSSRRRRARSTRKSSPPGASA